MSEEEATETTTEGEQRTDFQVNLSTFVDEPLRYTNLQHLLVDDGMYYLTFLAYAPIPITTPRPGSERPVQVVSRLVLTRDFAENLHGVLQTALFGGEGSEEENSLVEVPEY